MDIITIILFFIYTWGLGFTVTRFIKKPDNPLEEHLMSIGIGLSAFIVLSLFLNLLHIPLDWRLFLILSGALPLFYLLKAIKDKRMPHFDLKFTKAHIQIFAVLILFAFTFYMYHKGAFSYPYLEDDDSWSHALDAKYISIEKTAFVPKELNYTFSYMDAYPPAYDIILGVLHQTSPDLMWTMKFFNALLISLGIIFFYFFVKQFTGNSTKALISTFVLTMIPCYLSHFIWAHSLIPTLFFITIYCLEQIKYSKNWFFISVIAIAAIPITQPTQPVKLGVMFFIYWIVQAIMERKWLVEKAGSIALGYIVGIVIWWVPMVIKYGTSLLSEGLNYSKEDNLLVRGNYIGPIGSATRLYTFNDFFFAKFQNMINNPVGIGFIICLLSLLGIAFIIFNLKKQYIQKKSYGLITLLWFAFTFLGLYGGTIFPIALESFMFWMLLAIPVSIVTGEAVWFVFAIAKSIKIPISIVLIVIVISIWLTSGQQKFAVNTAMWGPGGWLGENPGTLYSFLWMKDNLKINTPIFVFSSLGSMVPGFNFYSCEWCYDIHSYRKGLVNRSFKETYDWLKNKGYGYVMVDDLFARVNGFNESMKILDEMINSNLYTVMYQPEINGQRLFSFVMKVN